MTCLSQGQWPLFQNGVPESLRGSRTPLSAQQERHLQSLVFPSFSPTLDKALHQTQTHYSSWYHTLYNGQKLTWNLNAGHCLVEASYSFRKGSTTRRCTAPGSK